MNTDNWNECVNMNVMSVRNTYSPKLRFLALVGLRPGVEISTSRIVWRLLRIPLVDGLLRLPLIDGLLVRIWLRCWLRCLGLVQAPISINVLRHDDVSTPVNIKQSRRRQSNNLTCTLTEYPVILKSFTAPVNKVMPNHTLVIKMHNR